MAEGISRTVEVGLATFTTPTGAQAYGLMGQSVLVSADDVERFDKYNKPISMTTVVDEGPSVVDVRRGPTLPEKVVMGGFGNEPITAQAQNIAIAAAQRQADQEAAAPKGSRR